MVCPIVGKKYQGTADVFLWNLSFNVGPGQPNKPDDAQFVALGYYCMGISNQGGVPESVRPIFQRVDPSMPYSGQRDHPLTQAIVAHERSRGGTQDGIVSVMKGAGAYDGSHYWIVRILNNYISLQARSWPRLDGVPKCPPGLLTATRAAFNPLAG